MKKFKYIMLSCALMLGMTSCEDWLDVNTDPDNPNNTSITVANRLPYIQSLYMYGLGATNFRTSCITGVYYSSNDNSYSTTWDGGATVTSYQVWFVGAAANLNDLYTKAEAEGAYHYMAAANVMHALGFMEMSDLFGEMPYTEALGESSSPAFDDGKTIYYGCLDKIDEAIELFQRTQEPGATSLSEGDIMNNGDVDKWLKLCYGLKARWGLKLSKKADLFNPDEVLSNLQKAPQSNDDNIYIRCYNSVNDRTTSLWGDPFQSSGNWAYAAYGNYQRFSEFHRNLLVNMRGSGVIDPRMEKIVPAIMCNVKLGTDGKVQSYDWYRSKGVDSYGEATRLVKGGASSVALINYAAEEKTITYDIPDATDRAQFIADMTGKHPVTVDDNEVTVTYGVGSIYVDDTNYVLAGDTAYVNLRAGSVHTGNLDLGELDVNWYINGDAMSAGVVTSTGSFQTRPVSDFDILTYHEMCFIKAEIYMRKGDKNNALAAYKEGIRAHLERMQDKLTEWQAAGYNNPDMWPMEDDYLDYLESAAVCQDAASLTMSDIMLQKFIAMGCNMETWNDMRRFNYSAGNVGDFGVVYPGYDRSPLFTGQAQLTGTSKTDMNYWYRRWQHCTLETGYNLNNVLASNANAMELFVWGIPVWWDCATDNEYFNGLK